jgi:hypothetical protein
LTVRPEAWTCPQRAEHATRRSWRDRGRDCTVALASTAVVAFLVAYTLTTPSFALDTAVSHVMQHPGARAIIQGRVLDADGDGIPGAEIRAHQPGGGIQVVHSGERGYFRLVLAGACAVSHIDVAVAAGGGRARTTLRRRLCPGDALEIDSRLLAEGQPIWFPTR